MKNIIVKLIIILIFLFFLTFDIYYYLFHKVEDCTQKQLETKNITIKTFQRLIAQSYLNDLNSINNCNLSYYGENNKLYNLDFEKPVLIFRFSIFNCSACVDFALTKLREHFPDFSSNRRIILIYDDENLRVSELMFGKMPYVTSQRDILGIPIEKSNTPAMFILDSEMKVKQFFVPEKSMPDLTDEYLNIIKKRYLNN